MSMTSPSPETRAITPIGCGQYFDGDVRQLFEALEFAEMNQRPAELEAIWTPNTTRGIFAPNDLDYPTLTSSLLDSDQAFALANIELARYEQLPYEQLSQRELNTRDSLEQATSRITTHRKYFQCYALVDALLRFGGVAVVSGSLDGVSQTIGFIDDFKSFSV